MNSQRPLIFDLLKVTVEKIYSEPEMKILDTELKDVHKKLFTFLRTCESVEDVIVFYELSVNLISEYLNNQATHFKLVYGVNPDNCDTAMFLGFLLGAWKKHETAMDCICFIFEFFDKYKCSAKLNAFKSLKFVLFTDYFILPFTTTLSKKIQFLTWNGREHKNSITERKLLLCINDLLLSLQDNDKRNIYGEIFENSFLKSIENIYKEKKLQFLCGPITMQKYLEMVNSCMIIEKNLAYGVLHPHTWKRVDYMMREVLVHKQMETITGNTNDGMTQLMDEGKLEKLKGLYDALLLVLGNSNKNVLLCMDIVIDCFRVVVKKNLLKLAQNAGIKNQANRKSLTPDDSILNFNFIVQRSLPIAAKDLNIIGYDCPNIDFLTSAIFQSVSDSDKQISMDFVEELHLLSQQAITIDYTLDLQMRGKFESIITSELQALFQHLPEEIGKLFALYANQAVKNKKINKYGNNLKMKKVINIISAMSAKFQEVFGYYYHLLLVRRYLRGETKSIVEERQALEKLVKSIDKSCFGFLLGVSTIFRDLAICEKMNKKSDRCFYLDRKHAYYVDFKVSVLNSYIWPVETLNAVNLPKPASLSWQEFKNSDHRVLSLVPQLGIAELRVHFYCTNVTRYPQVYSLVVDTYQMCVLMLFNDSDCLTFEEIQNQTGISVHHLKLVLQSLIQGIEGQSLLIPNKLQGKEHSSQLGPGYIFTVNEIFYSPRTYRLKVENVQFILKAKDLLSKNKPLI